MLHFHLKFSNPFSLILVLRFTICTTFQLRDHWIIVWFEFLVSSFECVLSSSTVVTSFFELFGDGFFFVSFSFNLGSQMNKLWRIFLILELILFKITKVSLKCLIDFALDKFLQTLVLLHFKFNVIFLWDQKLVAAEFLFIKFKFFLKSWHLINHLSLRIFQLSDDLGWFTFLLT